MNGYHVSSITPSTNIKTPRSLLSATAKGFIPGLITPHVLAPKGPRPLLPSRPKTPEKGSSDEEAKTPAGEQVADSDCAESVSLQEVQTREVKIPVRVEEKKDSSGWEVKIPLEEHEADSKCTEHTLEAPEHVGDNTKVLAASHPIHPTFRWSDEPLPPDPIPPPPEGDPPVGVLTVIPPPPAVAAARPLPTTVTGARVILRLLGFQTPQAPAAKPAPVDENKGPDPPEDDDKEDEIKPVGTYDPNVQYYCIFTKSDLPVNRFDGEYKIQDPDMPIVTQSAILYSFSGRQQNNWFIRLKKNILTSIPGMRNGTRYTLPPTAFNNNIRYIHDMRIHEARTQNTKKILPPLDIGKQREILKLEIFDGWFVGEIYCTLYENLIHDHDISGIRWVTNDMHINETAFEKVRNKLTLINARNGCRWPDLTLLFNTVVAVVNRHAADNVRLRMTCTQQRENLTPLF